MVRYHGTSNPNEYINFGVYDVSEVDDQGLVHVD